MQVLETIVKVTLISYGLLAISHILAQAIIGHLEYRKQKSLKFLNYHQNHNPSVSIVVPSYNETPELLEACLNSIIKQDYKGEIEVFVIDDGSENKEELMSIYTKYEKKGFKIIFNEKNVGKRDSQKKAFDLAKNEIIIAIDSDTIIQAPFGIKHIVKQFKNPEVGAVTGDVQVYNWQTNLLTVLIWCRYWMAFHQERAAQSYFNVLMCCSGPFAAYRKEIVDRVKEKYVTQYFLGKKCSYGDDRHLTNLVLEEGHKVVFDNKAIAFTNAPETLGGYIKQQTRWNKSFYREMIWTLKHIGKHHIYMLYDLTMQFILPFLLIFALIATGVQIATDGIQHLRYYIAMLILIALLRSLYAILRTRDGRFITFILYGFMHVFILIPVRIKALLTLGNTKWGTR